MKHLKVFETAALFEAARATLNTPNVSLVEEDFGIQFLPYVEPHYNLLDILYSDSNGNLSVSNQVLAASEGKTPIALCIAETGFFGTNEKARWMSLKYMDYETPDIGALIAKYIMWDGNESDTSTIYNIQKIYKDSMAAGGTLTADWTSNPTIPSVFNENNEWNISVLGSVNTYMMTDIDGKNKTNQIIARATYQENWQTDTSIINSSMVDCYPAVCCCWRYHTLGTQQGDWYLGASGEASMIITKKTDINTKLTAINTIYPNDCITGLTNYIYWTSTEYDTQASILFGLQNYGSSYPGVIAPNHKNNSYCVLSMLQY